MKKKDRIAKLKIEKMYAFISENDEGEGLMAFKDKKTWMPMVGADFKKVEGLVPIAEDLSKFYGIKYRIVEFSTRKDITEQILKKMDYIVDTNKKV